MSIKQDIENIKNIHTMIAKWIINEQFTYTISNYLDSHYLFPQLES